MSGLSYKDWKKIIGEIPYGDVDIHVASMLLEQWQGVFTSVFEWDIEGYQELGKYIEKYLYENGSAVFFKDEEKGMVNVLPYASTGGLNIHGELVNWEVLGSNGYKKKFNEDNSVMISANKSKSSLKAYVHYNVLRLADIEGAIETNVNQLKVPMIFSGDSNSLLTMKNIYKKIVRNEPVIYIDKKIENNRELKGVNTGANYFGDKLMKLYNDIEGRMLKVAGLKYVHTEKKERLIVDEVNSNDGLSNTFLWNALEEREKACEKITALYGIKCSVRINPLLRNVDPDKDNGEVIDDE